MKRVVIVSYWYPPNRTIGALRVAKMAKYLPEFGWEPLVITVNPESSRYQRAGAMSDEIRVGTVWRTRDRALTALFARAGRLGRSEAAPIAPGTPESAPGPLARVALTAYRQILCFPDECWPWMFEYSKIRDFVRSHRPDAILSSSPPATAHLIASRLSGDVDVPWVADFRDPWSQSHASPRTRLLQPLERRLELRTLRRAAALTTVSPPMRMQLASLHARPVHVIWNGFDEEPGPPQDAPRSVGARRIAFVHTGMLYPGKRDPRPLFAALESLRTRGVLDGTDLTVKFFGRNLWVVREALRDYPALEPRVEILGEVSYERSLAEQRQATVLLLLEWPDPRARGVVTGKLFEYLAVGRPVLATGPRGGVIDDLLRETQAGVLCTNATELETVLERWVRGFQSTGQLHVSSDRAAIARYSRRSQTEALAGVLDSVASTTIKEGAAL